MSDDEKQMTEAEKEKRRSVLDELVRETERLGLYDDPHLMIPKVASGSPDQP